MTVEKLAYQRVMLKLTGEKFGLPETHLGLSFPEIRIMAEYLSDLVKRAKIELVIVNGAGNLFRGRNAEKGFDRAQADYIGMIATIMNALALAGEMETFGVETRVMSNIQMNQVCEPFIRKRAIRHLQKGRIVITAAGTGRPYQTTDSAAALIAAELGCEVLLKGSNVDGIYNTDPRKDKNATKYQIITFQEALQMGLMVMDNTAFAMCQNQNIPIVVFNLDDLENIERIIRGEKVGTLVTSSPQ